VSVEEIRLGRRRMDGGVVVCGGDREMIRRGRERTWGAFTSAGLNYRQAFSY
jgi:hypothetical protein